MKNVKRFFKVLQVISYEEKNYKGEQKLHHEFSRVFEADNFHDCIGFLSDFNDGRFIICVRTSKKFLYSHSCFIDNGVIIFPAV